MHGIRIFNFKKWAALMQDEINENAKKIAQKNSIDIEFIRKKGFRKEKRVKEIISERGDHPGIVNIFSAMESSTAFNHGMTKRAIKHFSNMIRAAAFSFIVTRITGLQRSCIKRGSGLNK
jgi:hypothetical protein